MKKLLVLLLCVVLLGAFAINAYAEETPANVEQSGTVEVERTKTEIIKDYASEHFEEILVVFSLVMGSVYDRRKRRKLELSVGTLNNNAVSVAENSATAIQTALSKVEAVTEVVNGYKEEMQAIIGEIRKTAEEKHTLEEMLKQVEVFLKSSKLATLEMSNEVAELLVLANIPNSKKEELYARHLKAVNELAEADEVMSHGNDGTEA